MTIHSLHSRLKRLEQNQKIQPWELQKVIVEWEKAIQVSKEEYLKSKEEESQGQAPSV